MDESKEQTKTERKDGYIRVILTPVAIVSAIMFYIYDAEALTILMINETIVFAELHTPWFLTEDQRTFAGQLLFSLYCAAYLCVCIIAICTKDEPVDAYKPSTSPISTIRISNQLGQLKLRETGIFLFGSCAFIYMGAHLWMLTGGLIWLFLLFLTSCIEFIFQFDTPKNTIQNASQALIYIWLILPCFVIFLALFNLRAKDKIVINL
jgi:hypothetical protein